MTKTQSPKQFCAVVAAALLCWPGFALAIPDVTLPKSWELSSAEVKAVKAAFKHLARDRFTSAEQAVQKLDNKLIRDYFAWRKYQADSRFADVQDMLKFAKTHSHWPKQYGLWTHIESRIDSDFSAEEVRNVFKRGSNYRKPVTSGGKRLLAENLLDQGLPQYRDFAEVLLKKAWVDIQLSSSAEKELLKKYKHVFDDDDILKRIKHLVWNNRFSEAKRLLRRLPDDQEKLYKARILLRGGGYGVDSAVRAVPRDLQYDEGLVYDRIRWREKRKITQNINQLLAIVPAEKEYPTQFWKTLRKYVNALREAGKYKLAYPLPSQHGFSPSQAGGYADAEWVSGWLALQFLESPREAYVHFHNVYKMAKTPVTLGRAAYWAGRAAEANGNNDIAQNWYKQASEYPTSFYGQLAAANIDSRGLTIPAPTNFSGQFNYAKHNNDLLQVANMLYSVGQSTEGFTFLLHVFAGANSVDEKYHVLGVAARHDKAQHVINFANRISYGGGPVLLEIAYPTLDEWSSRPYDWGKYDEPEFALIHSIIRQESRFDQWARSGANAYGLMQLLPSTAKEVARSEKVRYKKSKLTADASYNVRLGSSYLQSRIDYYGGSYILAAAAYNAGATNVNKWLDKYGDPRDYDDVHDVVDWMESIPFKETRNYVQRVIEQLQLYRMRFEGQGRKLPLLIEDDLKRG